MFNNLVPEYLGLKLARIQVAYIVTECGELCNFSGRAELIKKKLDYDHTNTILVVCIVY